MAIYVAPIGSGMGDVVVCRPVFDTLMAKQSEPVFLVARGPRQVGMAKLIDGLAGEVKEPQLKEILQPGDRHINLRDHPLQRRHDWLDAEFYATYPGINIQKALKIICADLGLPEINDEFRPLSFQHDSRSVGKIIFVPATTMKAKTLESAFWLALHKRLQQQQRSALMLGSLEYSPQMQELHAQGIPHIPTAEISDAVNLISSCAGVVSVDTGLMHVAVQQGVRTVAIFGQWHLYYRPRENCRPIFAAPTPECGQYRAQTTEFGCDYETWDWFPPRCDEGSYLQYNDVQRVIDLL